MKKLVLVCLLFLNTLNIVKAHDSSKVKSLKKLWIFNMNTNKCTLSQKSIDSFIVKNATVKPFGGKGGFMMLGSDGKTYTIAGHSKKSCSTVGKIYQAML